MSDERIQDHLRQLHLCCSYVLIFLKILRKLPLGLAGNMIFLEPSPP